MAVCLNFRARVVEVYDPLGHVRLDRVQMFMQMARDLAKAGPERTNKAGARSTLWEASTADQKKVCFTLHTGTACELARGFTSYTATALVRCPVVTPSRNLPE